MTNLQAQMRQLEIGTEPTAVHRPARGIGAVGYAAEAIAPAVID